MASPTLLFDLDGTLVDSLNDLASALNLLRGELGLVALPLAEVRAMVGDGARKLVQRALPASCHDPSRLQRFLDLYATCLTRETRPYPGITALLESLAGHPVAIVTNKPVAMARTIVTELGLGRHVPVVVGGDSCAKKKPHPMPVREALGLLETTPDQAVMIGDHHTDLRSGAAAGCRTCFCSWGYGHEGGDIPTWRVASVSDLAQLLSGLRA